MPPIPSDHDDDYDPDLRETAISPNRKGKARADSDTEYSPRKRARGANGKHKAVESPRRRGRRKADSSSDIEFVGSSQPKTWRRFLLSDTEEEPVKRSAGQPRQSIGTARTASQQATPRTAVSRRTPSGPIFAAGRYPLTFYVAPSDNDLLERLIPSEGGGDLVPASEANIIILPLAQGDAPATREHRKLVETARGGLGRVVSEDWAWDCFRARPPALLDLDEYEVRLEEAGSSQRSVPRSSQKSAPSSSQRPAPSSSQRPTASAVTTPAKRRRDSSVAFEEDHRWDSARKKSHEIAYYDDEEIDFGGILEEHVERVELLIHYLRRWDKNGNKDDFIKSLGKTNSVRGAADIYYNKGYQQLIDRQVPGLLRAARRAAGSSPRQPKSQVTPSKSQPTPSRSQPTPTKPAKTTPAANDINIHHVKEEHKDRVIELVRALRAWDKVGSKSQKLKDLGPEIPGAMTLYYAYRDLVDEQVPGL
ncbi:hypothetical protein Q8F55_005558 [Vanrija albida]|uniref:BRCT domain-containing protein n=1 Tax=Vanrija albida TaxID=181172 RepID=A0ABR3Q1Y1_9TREE